jgi:DNA-binding NarL/FixJ family response regulator
VELIGLGLKTEQEIHMPTHSAPYPQRSVNHQQPVRRIRVLLVDDHILVRQGLRTYLDRYADIELVDEAADGEEAVKLADLLRPAVVVMDINMPRMNGIEATGHIMRKHPHLHVIGLSFDVGKRNREAMLEAGARMLLDKESWREQLYHAIHQAVDKSSDASSPRHCPVA